MYEITRWLEFDAGHRVLYHKGKCAHLHGHRYKIGFVLRSNEVGKDGMLLDFGFIKQEWGSWIDTNLDHGVILWINDPLYKELAFLDPDGKRYPLPYQATAEGIAKFLYQQFTPTFPQEWKLEAVRVFETPNCEALYRE